MYIGESFTFKLGKREFIATIHHDDSHGAPWDEECGHGDVSEWTTRDKLPGELVLSNDRGRNRFYDFAGACRIARQDKWGFLPGELITDRFARSGKRKFRAYVKNRGDLVAYGSDINMAIRALYDLHKSTLSPRQYAAGAAMRDYERLRAWCNDEWTYCGVVVRLADSCDCCGQSESLWGIETDSDEYLIETAKELASEL